MKKIKFHILSLLSFVVGSKSLRNKKLMAGIVLLSSIASMLSCNQGRKTTCYVKPMDPSANSDTIVTKCYEKVVEPDTQNVVTPPADTSKIEDQIMCYKQVAPDKRNKKDRK